MPDARDKSKERTDAAKWVGVGAGIGSAAIAAALLYWNRDKVAAVVSRRTKPIEHED